MNQPVQAELDTVLKISAVRLVLDAYFAGHHLDMSALDTCGLILRRTVHRTLVCRVNHREVTE